MQIHLSKLQPNASTRPDVPRNRNSCRRDTSRMVILLHETLLADFCSMHQHDLLIRQAHHEVLAIVSPLHREIHGFIPDTLLRRILVELVLALDLARLTSASVTLPAPPRSLLTFTSHSIKCPFHPPPAIRPLLIGLKANEPVPSSKPFKTCSNSPVSALNSLTVVSCPPLPSA